MFLRDSTHMLVIIVICDVWLDVWHVDCQLYRNRAKIWRLNVYFYYLFEITNVWLLFRVRSLCGFFTFIFIRIDYYGKPSKVNYFLYDIIVVFYLFSGF